MKVIISDYFFSKNERRNLIIAGILSLLLLFNQVILKQEYNYETFSYFFTAILTLVPFGIFYKQVIKPTFIGILENKLQIRLNPFQSEEPIEFNKIEEIVISKYNFEIKLKDGNSRIINLSNFSYQQRNDELTNFVDQLKSKMSKKVIQNAI